MLMSKQQNFSEAQNLTSTGASTNTIDLGTTGTVLKAPAALVRDIGKGNPVPILAVLTADAGGTSPTLQVDIEVDDNDSFSSATVVDTKSVSGGSAGDEILLEYIPQGANERYIRLNYTLGGASPDYTITAGIVAARQTSRGVAGA